MKDIITIVALLVSGVVCEPPAPYPPSGWRPSGPTLELPQRIPAQDPQAQDYLPPVDPRYNTPQKQQEYLPPVASRNPGQEYGTPDDDVSVQGLPAQEQLPIFQLTPVNGQQYVGPNFNADVRSLDQRLQQAQYQQQQEIYRQFARQRQLEAEARQAPQSPRQFVPRPTTNPTQAPSSTARPNEARTTQTESSTEPLNLNEGETIQDQYAAPSPQKKEKVTVEVTKQNVQEYPPELYLNPLAQLRLQQSQLPQFVQLGQIRAPVYFQAAENVPQNQVAAYEPAAQYAALPSILAQQQLQSQAQYVQNQPQLVPNQQQLIQSQPQLIQSQPQYAQSQPQYVQGQQIVQNPAFIRGQEQANPAFVIQSQQPLNQYQPAYNQYEPQVRQPNQYEIAQPQMQTYPQFQAQPAIVPQGNQVQPNYAQPKRPEAETDDQPQPQFVYQQSYQPEIYQQPYQGQLISPAQLVNYPNQDYYQQQFLGQTAQQQSQGGLQSGLDVNQQGNGIDQGEDKETDDEDEGSTATAVATAFGTRTQPRVYATYGAPVPRAQANPNYQTTTESADESATEDGPAIAEATAVARGGRRKLRTRVRPVFTLDRSGHLVLAQQQQN